MQIGPDTIVHICSGTYSLPTDAFWLAFQGSGTSGHVVTLLFDSGAIATSPAWSANGAINTGGQGFLLIDGGLNGTLTSTANGSGLANHNNSMGIQMSGSHDIEIRNLTITNLYKHSSPTDLTPDPTATGCIYANTFGNNISIHDNTFIDGPWCINLQFATASSGLQIYNNNIGAMAHGITLGGSAGGHLSNVTIYNNHIHDFGNWGTGADEYHLTGIHVYGANGTSVANIKIYNNLWDGTWGNAACPGSPGACITAFVFIEGGESKSGISGLQFFNNVGIADAPINNGLFGIYDGNFDQVYNNTMIGSTTNDGVCFGANQPLSGFDFRNNLMTNCGQLISIQTLNFNPSAPDHNLYASGGSNSFVCGSNFYNFSQFANWKSCIGSARDANSLAPASGAQVDATGTLQANSLAIAAGANLTSLGITALDFDKNGIPRPSTGPWDIGAYQFGQGTTTLPSPPVNLSVVVR
jgi:hypothetical protein